MRFLIAAHVEVRGRRIFSGDQQAAKNIAAIINQESTDDNLNSDKAKVTYEWGTYIHRNWMFGGTSDMHDSE